MRRLLCMILIISVFSLVFFGCSSNMVKVPMDETSVNVYFQNVPEASNECIFVYEDINGINFLKGIHDSSTVKSMSFWYNDGIYCKLTGCYDGNWFYGWGTEEKLLVAYGTDKDQVYSLMQGYGI